MARYWAELATTEFGHFDRECSIAILPVGAVEQHGPHLPVGVDTYINRAILDRAMPLLPDTVLVLPTMDIGKSNEHLAFPGTLSFSAETVIRMWTELGECVMRAGIAKLVFFNSHGGNPQLIDIVARELRVRFGMFAVACNRWGLIDTLDEFPDVELKHGIHGGAWETSEMMHLHPTLVHGDACANFVSAAISWERQYRFLRPEGGIGFGWQTQDLHAAGAAGDATLADADKGGAMIATQVNNLIRLIDDVIRFPLENLKAGPLGTDGQS